MKINLEHVHTVKKRLADGSIKVYRYHRLTGKPIKGQPGSLAFHAAYEEACQFQREQENTFSTLIADFFGSKIFQKLSPRTQNDYTTFRDIIEPDWGATPLAVFEDRRVAGDFMKWRDKLADKRGDRQADLIFALARRIVSFGVKPMAKISVNHLTGIEAIYKADRSDVIWLPEHVEAFWEVATPKMKLALILALNLGRRMGDLIALTWGDYSGEFINVTNRKGRRKVKFPSRRL